MKDDDREEENNWKEGHCQLYKGIAIPIHFYEM